VSGRRLAAKVCACHNVAFTTLLTYLLLNVLISDRITYKPLRNYALKKLRIFLPRVRTRLVWPRH